MKTLKTTAAIVSLVCSMPTYAASQTSETKTAISKSPMEQKLTWKRAELKPDPRCYAKPNDVYNNIDAKKNIIADEKTGEEIALLGTIATSLIGTGIDLIGSELADSAKEKTYTTSAVLNVLGSKTKTRPVACMILKRKGHYEFKFAMKPTDDKKYIEPILLDYQYQRSISGKKSGKRGVVILMNFFTPDKGVNISQSINLGNLKLNKEAVKDVNFASPYILNPIPAAEGSPITASFTLTEVKDANKLLQLTSDTFDGSKATLKSEFGKIVRRDGPPGG